MGIERRIIAAIALAVSAPAAAPAQPVLLQIRPRPGDTFLVRLDQRVEMRGMPAHCVSGSIGARKPAVPDATPAGCEAPPREMTTVMEVFSRAVVERVDGDRTLVRTFTDSTRRGMSSGASKAVSPRRVPGISGSMDLLVATDGGAEVVDAEAPEPLRSILGQMPATLSRRAVSVGEKWTRQMQLPATTEAGTMALVRATFTLDSLGRNGDLAYISMRGTLSHEHDDGSDSDLDGRLTGSIVLDRRVAWITYTRAVIDIESTVKPAAGGTPMRVRTRITQVLRARRL